MSEDLVTVSTFPNVQLAHLARQHLQNSGIQSFITEENSGGLFGDAVGWVKLQAAKEDALRATAVLEAEMPYEPDAPSEDIMLPQETLTRRDTISDTDPDEMEEEESPSYEPIQGDEIVEDSDELSNERSRLVERALAAAVFGIIFFPVQFYASYLLFRVWNTEGTLTESAQRRLLWAVLINVPLALLVALAFGSVLATGFGLW
jgi:hypothetical protein